MAHDSGVQVKNSTDQGGSATVIGGTLDVASGGVATIKTGASLVAEPGATVTMNLSLTVINKTGASIATDQLVAVTTLDATSGVPKIVLADADVAGLDHLYVTTAAIADGAQGTVVRAALSAANLNTNAATSAGDAVYLDTTAGGFTVTPPSTAVSRVHQVGMVVVKSATVGQILWLIGPVRIIGTNEIQPATVTNAQLASRALQPIAKTNAAAVGYATGAGAAATQATNRSTGVTCSGNSGAITTNNTSLAAEAAATFVVTNTSVEIGDVVVVSQRSGSNSGNTDVFVSAVGAGSFSITVSNNNAAAGTAETGAIIINFAIIKAVSA